VLAATAGGCALDRPWNPSLPVTVADARQDLLEMADAPRPLARPLVVLGGIHDPGFIASGLRRRVARVTDDEDSIIAISFIVENTFDKCRDRVISEVEERYAHDDPTATVEVDVLAFSMGGLVARHAARPRPDGKRLRIRRLFTISSPHRGARLARLPTLDARVKDMRPGSEFLVALDEALAEADYELLTYARLHDVIVGAPNTSAPGVPPWWVASIPWTLTHMAAASDPRITADIARRLRGDEPVTLEPPFPMPGAPDEAESP
jgi:hypothetical protein